jgi:hypothetical protein
LVHTGTVTDLNLRVVLLLIILKPKCFQSSGAAQQIMGDTMEDFYCHVIVFANEAS